MRYVVAVSGGVDSVVLLHQMVQDGGSELVVAHFDHGIRDDSHLDARFVRELAQSYQLPFEMRREELGSGTSEELARTRRYAFLYDVAKKYQGTIVTAHHINDIAETVAINLTRGTGWRGLAVLAGEIRRPLLHTSKEEIIAYAREHNLRWREDSTNASDVYLRNRLRRHLGAKADERTRELAALRAHQVALRKEIDRELEGLPLENPYSRYFINALSDSVAMEVLRSITMGRLTRPQLKRARIAIATQQSGKVYEAGSGVTLSFTPRHFSVQMIK